MRIYRLVKQQHAQTAFAGVGALRYAGRWHKKGTPIVYAADQPSSALVEVLVHTSADDLLRHEYVLFTIDLDPDRHLLRLPRGQHPDGWRGWRWSEAAQRVGTRWAEMQRSVVLEVPSAVVSLHHNYLVNPQHPAFSDLVIGGPEPFAMDPRLARRAAP